MFTSKHCLPALAICLSLIACRSGFAISDKGFCADMSIIDVRIGYGFCSAGDVELTREKNAVSPEGAELLSTVVEKAVRAALICAGVGAVSAAGAACSVLSLPVPEIMEEVVPE